MSYFPWLTILFVLPIFAGSSIIFFTHRRNKVYRWYTLYICILEFLLMIYLFCFYFVIISQLDDPVTQSKKDSK
uniref:NADH dehydrogenase subunit D n=1 Tax=Phalaenopsis subparishii TaxID=1486051 RepID=UPI002E77A6DC|nr:NADH dehydrogenase subunit D [Phalaenopsis subparishii]WQH62543.1 NADH dehydrogenase subunit D [Phalaenopsis subparishii]